LRSHNLALGDKIPWKLVTGKILWSKQDLWKKYYAGDRRKCLDKAPKASKGSPIFTICHIFFGFFNPLLTWIHGNEKNILIWEDSILGGPPLDSMSRTSDFKEFIHSQNLTTLWDISNWHNDEAKAWK
jgi:hypothetical protein